MSSSVKGVHHTTAYLGTLVHVDAALVDSSFGRMKMPSVLVLDIFTQNNVGPPDV